MNVFEFVPEGIQDCSVTAWLHGKEPFRQMGLPVRQRPAIIICLGGGYEWLSEREAESPAKYYFAAGYNTFILRYSIGEKAKDFYPLRQLASTIAHVRKYADEWYTLRDKIAVSGFSAGGHLACSLGTLFNEEKFLKAFGRDDDIRPNAMVLSYPVIVSDEYTHKGTMLHVSGAPMGSEEYKWFGLDRHVDAETPPTFMWHTAADELVPVENSLRLAAALSVAKVPFELHVFPEGEHGLSVCNREVNTPNPHNERWVEWSIQWLNKTFDFER